MFLERCAVKGCDEPAKRQHGVDQFLRVLSCDKHNGQVRKLMDELSVEAVKQHLALKNKYLDKIENLKP